MKWRKPQSALALQFPRLMLGGRDHDGNSDCHDRPVPRIEVQGQSLGQYHRGYHHHCLYLVAAWRTHILTISSSPLSKLLCLLLIVWYAWKWTNPEG